jgi:single-stranded-DNA-specific exonuclease
MEPLAEAKRLGMDVVVIDHHQCGDELPIVDALVNPNRLDDLSGLGHLAAVGLVFVTLVAVNRELRARNFWSDVRPEPNLLDALHHVALGTVADVAVLTGLNRAFVAKGLIALRRRDHVGHTALMDVARLSGPPEAWHLGFMLGPRINAGGRIGRADLGVRLLLEGDVSEAARIAAELDRLNTERRVIEQQAEAQAEAEALASLGLDDKGSVIVTASEGGIRAWWALWRRGSRRSSPGQPSPLRWSPAASAQVLAAPFRVSISARWYARPCRRGFC